METALCKTVKNGTRRWLRGRVLSLRVLWPATRGGQSSRLLARSVLSMCDGSHDRARHRRVCHERIALSAELVTPARLRLKKAEESSQADGEMTRRLQEIVAQEEARMKTIDDSALATSEEIGAFFKGLRKQLKKREGELLSEVGRKQRRLTAPSEAAFREAKGMLASIKLTNKRAARGQRFSSDTATVEEDGAVSKRLEALQREMETLSSRVAENAAARSASLSRGSCPR